MVPSHQHPLLLLIIKGRDVKNGAPFCSDPTVCRPPKCPYCDHGVEYKTDKYGCKTCVCKPFGECCSVCKPCSKCQFVRETYDKCVSTCKLYGFSLSAGIRTRVYLLTLRRVSVRSQSLSAVSFTLVTTIITNSFFHNRSIK